MANIYKGVGVHWGVGSTTCTQFGTCKIQSRDHQLKSESETIKDAEGVTVTKIYYDPTQEITFEYIPTAASGGVVTPTMPDIGTFITMSNDTAYTAIASKVFLVDDVSTKSSNTGVMRVTVKATHYPQIVA